MHPCTRKKGGIGVEMLALEWVASLPGPPPPPEDGLMRGQQRERAGILGADMLYLPSSGPQRRKSYGLLLSWLTLSVWGYSRLCGSPSWNHRS